MNPNGWAISLDSPEHATAGATDHLHPWHPVATTQTAMTFGTILRHSSERGPTTSWHGQNWVSPVGPKLHGPLFGPRAMGEFAHLKMVDHRVTSQGNSPKLPLCVSQYGRYNT